MRRMFGKTRRRKTRADDTYYACVTKREHHKTERWYDQHPPAPVEPLPVSKELDLGGALKGVITEAPNLLGPSLAEQMGSRGRRYVSTHFSMESARARLRAALDL